MFGSLFIYNIFRIIKDIAPFIQRTLLYGDDNLDLTVNQRIKTETLRIINDSKRFA